jgi:hypothetical protein
VPEFAHLHLHTEYSLLDGMGRMDEYVELANEHGIRHIAVTDHGVMYASLEWYKKATKAGLHPIIGMEAYLSHGPAADATGRCTTGSCWRRTTRGTRTSCGWRRREPRGLLLQAADRPRDAGPSTRGCDRHLRLPGRAAGEELHERAGEIAGGSRSS